MLVLMFFVVGNGYQEIVGLNTNPVMFVLDGASRGTTNRKEGLPSNGDTFDLRVEALKRSYPELWGDEEDQS